MHFESQQPTLSTAQQHKTMRVPQKKSKQTVHYKIFSSHGMALFWHSLKSHHGSQNELKQTVYYIYETVMQF